MFDAPKENVDVNVTSVACVSVKLGFAVRCQLNNLHVQCIGCKSFSNSFVHSAVV